MYVISTAIYNIVEIRRLELVIRLLHYIIGAAGRGSRVERPTSHDARPNKSKELR